MTSISAVKLALKRGKNRDALYLLRKVIKQKPSAEAHYLAAKLAPNPIMARKQLQCALNLDPNYEPAHTMLQLIEREAAAQTRTGKLRSELVNAFEEDNEDNADFVPQNYIDKVKKWMFA
jgi:hypothetical protein